MVKNIDYHIIDKCNMNCASCGHFSSLAPADDNGKSIEQITSDLTLLSKIKDEFRTLSILGGEPTLHPQLSKILRIAREIFPNNELLLVTNGVKYDKFNLWKDAIIENNIHVNLSLYPYVIDYRERAEIIKRTLGPDVVLTILDFPVDGGFYYQMFTNRDNAATESELLNCWNRFQCCQVKNGKLYICNLAAQFNVLKDYFGDKITFDYDGKEYLDLNGDITADDFYNFMYNAHPKLCDHCIHAHNIQNGMINKPWDFTKRDIKEWMVD